MTEPRPDSPARDQDRTSENIGDLRTHTARGTIINSAFQVGLVLIGLVQRVAIAAFLTREEFGLWGIILTILITLSWIKELGIVDKFVQQSEPDQELAWQKAFTLELYSSCAFLLVVAAILPLYALAYGRDEIIVPALVLSLSVPLLALQAPAWVYYRRLQYTRQRLLTAVDPVVALAATLALGVAGFGYWSLVLGVLAGRLAGGAVCLAMSPYPVRLRIDRATVRSYASFSWPLVGSGVSALLVVQGTLLAADQAVSLAAVGTIVFVSNIVILADRVDSIVSQTLYPAVCAVVDRKELLFEIFAKSNRLALMWAMPFGAGLALFAGDFVGPVFGDEWEPAAGLLAAIGVTSAFAQVAFNWEVFLRALDWTKPMFISAVLNLLLFAVVAVPAILTFGLTGYAVGSATMTLGQIVFRWHYMRRVFDGFRILPHLARALAPTLPPVGAVLLVRLAVGGDRSLSLAVAEAVLYGAAVIVCTGLFERKLLGEALGYLRGRRPRTVVAPASPRRYV